MIIKFYELKNKINQYKEYIVKYNKALNYNKEGDKIGIGPGRDIRAFQQLGDDRLRENRKGYTMQIFLYEKLKHKLNQLVILDKPAPRPPAKKEYSQIELRF